MSRKNSVANSIVSVGGTPYDSDNRIITVNSLKGRNAALDFALKQTDAKSDPEKLLAFHALVNAGRRSSNASVMSTDSLYGVRPTSDGMDLRVSRTRLAKGRVPGADEGDSTAPIRRPKLAKFGWSGRRHKVVDPRGNIEKTTETSITIPNVFTRPGKQGTTMGGEYESKGSIRARTHTKSRSRMLGELSEASAKPIEPKGRA